MTSQPGRPMRYAIEVLPFYLLASVGAVLVGLTLVTPLLSRLMVTMPSSL